MEKVPFKIRRRIISAFLFSLTSVIVFAALSFQAHLEIGHRLKLLEFTHNVLYDLLEMRRYEKNFFLYHQFKSIQEAINYASKVEELYLIYEKDVMKLKKDSTVAEFPELIKKYQNILVELMNSSEKTLSGADLLALEDSLRNYGQKLLGIAERWEIEERSRIDELFKRTIHLFLGSIGIFLALGIVIAFYLARIFVEPLLLMKKAMDKIASGDFTPIPESGPHPEEFEALFQAFNRMVRELEIRQEQLAQSKKMAAVGTLTAGIAHELNNPINNIVLTAETLREEFHNLDAKEVMSLINDIISQADRASEIVKGLLDFSRSEYPQFEPLSIASAVEYTLKLVRNQLSLAGIQVDKDFPPNLPLVYGDRKGLQQVFLNLIINAIQAMPGGGNLTLRASLSKDGKWIKVDVIDTGVGIDPKDLPYIFDPFYTTKQVGKGTGLGLSVSYGIIEKHGGRIEVESERGKGSKFTVVLPAYRENDD
ncbi:MAG: ATP-binding protein [Thermodesulforhabdaceae bacterium]